MKNKATFSTPDVPSVSPRNKPSPTSIRPPFTLESATAKVRAAEDAWNSRAPHRVSLAYSEDSPWRNRSQFVQGREQIREFLTDKWKKELDYRLTKSLWSFTENRIAATFQPGDRIGVGWVHSSSGSAEEDLRAEFKSTGRDSNGGYAQYMTVAADDAYPIPACFTNAEAAPLLRARATGDRAGSLLGLSMCSAR